MKKVRKICVPLLIATSIFATSVFAAPSVSGLENKKNQAEQEMKTLKDELAGIMTAINDTERKLVAKGEAIIDATQRLEEAKANEEKQHDDMMKRIVVMYERGNDSVLQLLLESGGITDMLQRMENVQALHEYDRNELQKYIKTKEEIAELKVALEEEQQELKKLQSNLEQQEVSLNKKIKEKRAEVQNIEAQIAEAARIAAEEAERKAREEAENKKNQLVLNKPGYGSDGGVKYTGTGDQSVGNAIVAAARKYIGVWYLWGGNDFNGIDCSGLTKAAHAAVGIYIDRWSGHQAIGGKAISSVAQARPGDIICYSGHVAIYIGNERVIHAPRTGKQVQEAGVYMKEIIAIRRYW